jgi:phytoene desaturase
MEGPQSMKNDHLARGSGKVAVIGAGIGGMATAARLAKAGFKVTVFEASSRHGGKCRTEWVGKFAFDTGPSLLTIPAVYRDFFQRTGDVMGRVLEISPVNPSFDYRFADGKSIKFENLSRKKTLAAISDALGSQSADEWDHMLLQAEAMWDVSREPFIESELKSPLSLLKRPRLIRDFRLIAPWKTLRDIKINSPHLRKILDRYATYSGSDPRVAPAVLSTIAFIEEAFGAWHIKGGVGTLSDAIYKRACDVGVTFEFNCKVKEICHDGKKITGLVTADGRKLDFTKIIANADAGTVYNELIQGKVRKIGRARKAIYKSELSLAGFSLLLGLRPDSNSPRLEHHTILFPDDYDAEFTAIFDAKKPVAKPTIYICAPHDETMVKDAGYQAWSVLVNAPRHDVRGVNGFDWSDQNFVNQYAQEIISQIESAGISVRERLEVLEIRTPLDLQNEVLAPGGSIYGTSSNGARSAFLRAKNRSPLKGLYLVGGSAHPGGGLPLVGLSAEIVSLAVLEKK